MKNKQIAITVFSTLLFLMTSVFFSSCNKGIIGTSHWQEKALKIDGSAADWKDTLLYDYKSHFLYTILNDNKNLYVCIKIVDLKNQMKILRRGITIWFDTTGRNKKAFGVKFPLSGVASYHKMSSSEKNTDSGDLMKDMKTMEKMLISEQRDLEMIGFTLLGYEKKESVKVSLLASLGIKVAIGIDSTDCMIYEMSVPLSYLFKTPAKALNDNNRVLSVGMESGDNYGGTSDGEGRGSGSHSGSGGMGGGGRGGMGGGMRGGGMGGSGSHGGGMHSGSSSQNRDTDPIKTWIEVKLAKSKN